MNPTAGRRGALIQVLQIPLSTRTSTNLPFFYSQAFKVNINSLTFKVIYSFFFFFVVEIKSGRSAARPGT